jgi:hypothetical protein
MLSDDEEEEKHGFEDIDLDKVDNEDESSSEKLSNLQHLLANYMDEE